MKFNWRKREKEPIKPLTEKEIQQQLYGPIKSTRKSEDKTQIIIKELGEKFEKEKAELTSHSAREKESLIKEKQRLTKEKERTIEEKRQAIIEKEKIQRDLSLLRIELEQTRKKLNRALSSTQQDKTSREHQFQVSAVKTIFNLSPKLLILSLVILTACFISLKIIYPRTPQTNTKQVTKKAPIKRVTKKAPPKIKKEPVRPVNKYTVQICVYEKESEAKKLVNGLKEKKYPAYFATRVSSKGKTHYNIYVGKFPTEKAASSFLNKLKNAKEFKEFKDSFVKKL